MNTDNPAFQTISVVIPAYNAEKTIRKALQSVLEQTRPPLEILVVDDGSSDGTREAVEGFGNAVRYIVQTNAGAGAARNTGIRAAQGAWIAFLDADDEWLPEKLDIQRQILRSHPELAWLSSNFYCRETQGSRMAPDIRPETVRAMLRDACLFSDFFDAAAKGIHLWTGTMLIRKEVFSEAGFFDESLRHGEEDTDLWWKIAYRFPAIGYSPAPLAVYSVDMHQSLTRKPRNLTVFTHLLDRHLVLAGQYHRMEAFRPAASKKLMLYIRSMLFEHRGSDIRSLVRRYEPLFSRFQRFALFTLTAFPSLTAKVFHGISFVIRRLGLRRRVTPPPVKTRPAQAS